MAVQTGSTLWDGSIKYGAYGNGKYGLIDTTGKFVSANDFDGIQWNYTRIIGKRGDKFYLIAPDGGETALPKNLDQYSAWTTAEVDSAAEHGLSLVNYHYPRLDITRVDFAAQAVQLYRVLTPDGQAAPDETPYSDCDDENVRLAAAPRHRHRLRGRHVPPRCDHHARGGSGHAEPSLRNPRRHTD